ncbi:hypothetical protein M0P65_07960 [Candidatus Gracilibacteria bacterium]|jgi:hypothetical protein|nr:hypothetical protein [Candidatus Gracilibacteria bacterium]
MSWGLILNGLYLNKTKKSDLDSELEGTNSIIKLLENKLVALVAYTTPTYYEDNSTNWPLPEYAALKVPEILEELSELYEKRMLIKFAIENPKEITEDY